MKQYLKSYIQQNKTLSDLIFEKGIGSKIKLSHIIINKCINFILRQNTTTGYPVNFRSTVIAGQNLCLKGSKRGTLSSLVNSTGCYLQAGNQIIIGEGTIWGPNVLIISANHNLNNNDKGWEDAKPVIIGAECWIGGNTSILPSVHIGDNTIVGAGSVVTKSFPKGNQVIAGNPARVIKEL